MYDSHADLVKFQGECTHVGPGALVPRWPAQHCLGCACQGWAAHGVHVVHPEALCSARATVPCALLALL